MGLRVLAVDDEAPALDDLAHLLGQDPRIDHVATAGDAVDALRDLVQSVTVGGGLDAVFLDLRMPGLDGVEMAQILAGLPDAPRLVFVTAHPDAAVRAFDLRAVDYLLKPVRPERLAEAVRRLSAGTPAPAAPEADEIIPVELGGRTKFVRQRAIWYAQAQGDYVRLHTAEGAYLVRASLASLARRWEAAGFLRIHRSTLAATRHITELRFDDGRAFVVIGEAELPVSRRHAREVREYLLRRPREVAFG